MSEFLNGKMGRSKHFSRTLRMPTFADMPAAVSRQGGFTRPIRAVSELACFVSIRERRRFCKIGDPAFLFSRILFVPGCLASVLPRLLRVPPRLAR